MTRSQAATGGTATPSEWSCGQACGFVTRLLLRWQETGSHAAFESLVDHVRPHVERVAACTLRRHGLRDPAACDDAVALVLDHLRRLPGEQSGERRVAKFVPGPDRSGSRVVRDPGLGFITWLAADRGLDVVRSCRRRRSVPFSQLGAEAASALEQNLVAKCPLPAGQLPIDRVREAAVGLEPRQRVIVELLLDGTCQTVIAHMIGVSEGTVSRLRCRAIAAIQGLLAD